MHLVWMRPKATITDPKQQLPKNSSDFFSPSFEEKMHSYGVQDNPFYEVTLTPDLAPNLKSFLLLKKSSFYSQ